MLARTTAVAILGFCSSLGLAAPLATDANSLDMPAAIKERSTSKHSTDVRASFDVEKRSANPGTLDGSVDDKRATPLYWVDTLLQADEKAKKMKRATLERSPNLSDGLFAHDKKSDVPLYWVDTLLRADED